MKRFLFCILFLLLFNYISIATERNPQELDNQKYQLYNYYFITKEFCKFLYHRPFISSEKFNNAAIYCNKAHHKINLIYIWSNLICTFNESQINEIKNHVYADTTEELSLFMLKKSQELKLYCRQCNQYSGYYIPKESILQE